MRASPTVFAPDQKPWYLRTWALAAIGVLVLAIIVVSDFPRGTTTADRATQYALVQSQLYSGPQSCNSGLASSITAVSEILSGQSHDVSTASGILAQAEPNCTPVGNSDLLDLASINIPNILINYQIRPAIDSLDSWAFPNAAAVINDLKGLMANPRDASIRSDLVKRQTEMDLLAAKAQAIMNADAKIFSVPKQTLGLITIKSYPASIISG